LYLYSFCSVVSDAGICLDGASPEAPLIQASDGNFYGTTLAGGSGGTPPSQTAGGGTVFKFTPGGPPTPLYSFCSKIDCTDGANPEAGLIQASDGNFYGTTDIGGPNGSGTIFKLTPTGAETVFYPFCSQKAGACLDGENPEAGLIQDRDGNFYGTTVGGGPVNEGTAFKVTPAGVITTYPFCAGTQLSGCGDGGNPRAGLFQASDGNFYGTTYVGGDNPLKSDGTVFKLTPAGALTTLYSFCSQPGCADGENPQGGLIQDNDGNLYGTTSGGVITF
jgi:uncharacterized repeat protein (TIGR03803 family)